MIPATLLGTAVADALGIQFETLPYGDPRLDAWDVTFGDAPYHGLKAGQWSDDTMMSSILAGSLTEVGGFSPFDVSNGYCQWLLSGDLRGMGKTTKQALTRMKMGLPWTQTGIPGAEGNGTAMRAAPIGVFFRNNIQAVAEFARIEACLTHASEEAVAGSIAVATATAMLITDPHKDFVLKVKDWVPSGTAVERGLDLVFGEYLKWDGAPRSPRDVAKVLAQMGTKAHVVQTVPAAIYAFLFTGSYRDAVEAAVRAGGDTDTTAAIVGALAGAFYGIEQVMPLTEGLESLGTLLAMESLLYEGAPPVYRFGP